MSGTNIDLDDDLVREAMSRFGLRTKQEAVDLALRRLADSTTTATDIRAARGIGWDGDLDEMRVTRQ